jgi:hypothetical protein
VDVLCDEVNCVIFNDGKHLYHDYTHLTLSGSKYVSYGLADFIEFNILESTLLSLNGYCFDRLLLTGFFRISAC